MMAFTRFCAVIVGTWVILHALNGGKTVLCYLSTTPPPAMCSLCSISCLSLDVLVFTPCTLPVPCSHGFRQFSVTKPSLNLEYSNSIVGQWNLESCSVEELASILDQYQMYQQSLG
jgi:hypothetical protein